MSFIFKYCIIQFCVILIILVLACVLIYVYRSSLNYFKSVVASSNERIKVYTDTIKKQHINDFKEDYEEIEEKEKKENISIPLKKENLKLSKEENLKIEPVENEDITNDI